ncbi:MAG: phosphopyruvate hydratase [Tenericutes bacterium]|nr:phosphopyruvate hydratase [Mycoplasmatota bacterium]
MKIKNIIAREILDSRGNPTVEATVILEDNTEATASVPSGASTGVHEALELRDNDMNRYLGKGVLKAVSNVNDIIKPRLIGLDVQNQKEIDELLINLDGTPNKEVLGANAILAVSLACLKASSKTAKKELFEYIGRGTYMPRMMMNILNGGAHADNGLDCQEFMIIPMHKEIDENVRIGSEVFHSLKQILKTERLSTGVGDEGGFAPNINSTLEALNLIMDAIKAAGYVPGKDVYLALDVAASEFYNNGVYSFEGKNRKKEQMVEFYEHITEKFPIVSIEDGMAEDDYEGWQLLTEKLGDRIQLVGDDLFVTNKKLLEVGIEKHMANAVLIKLNQIGTVTEAIETILLAKRNKYSTIISHRSGETEDTSIADFAVGLNLGQIKTGSMSRGERICKYNRLMRINEKLNK